MKLKIKSNYWEKWHCYFDLEGIEFRLVNTDGPTRPEMYKMFTKIGLSTPLFGNYDVFVKNNFEKDKFVVVFDKINTHFGEDKRLVEFSALNIEDKLKFLCEYIKPIIFPPQEYLAKSTRYLFIGEFGYQYDYFSCNDWRSNNGRVVITEPMHLDIPKWRKEINYAMFAIDFVGEQNALKAIDFNCSPGIPDSLYKYMSGQEIVNVIKSWLVKYSNG